MGRDLQHCWKHNSIFLDMKQDIICHPLGIGL